MTVWYLDSNTPTVPVSRFQSGEISVDMHLMPSTTSEAEIPHTNGCITSPYDIPVLAPTSTFPPLRPCFFSRQCQYQHLPIPSLISILPCLLPPFLGSPLPLPLLGKQNITYCCCRSRCYCCRNGSGHAPKSTQAIYIYRYTTTIIYQSSFRLQNITRLHPP